jgi:2-methylcitrate dehydratase PrpD
MVIRHYAEFALASRAAPLSEEVSHASARALVDWFAATIPGAPRPAAQILRESVDFADGRGRASLIGGGKSDPRTAALINGTAAHIVEMDDIYREGIHHPGAPTIAAALAAAEHERVTGERLLRAIALGYEIGNNIAAAMQPAHYRYWHTTGTIGTIAAAAAVAEILQADAGRFGHALATATTCAAGLQQAFRSETMSKPLHAGNAATAGLSAAYAASKGFLGAFDVLDGDVGFGLAMSNGVDWERAISTLGHPWTVTQSTVKLHACCGHTFAAIDAALEIRERLPQAATINNVRIETYSVATDVAGIASPKTAHEGRFSLAFAVATALTTGSIGLEAFTDDRLADPDLMSIVSRTSLQSSDDFDATFPSQRQARVTVETSAGTFIAHRPTRKGDPDDPASDDDINDKFHTLADPAMGEQEASRLLALLWGVGAREDVSTLLGDRIAMAE